MKSRMLPIWVGLTLGVAAMTAHAEEPNTVPCKWSLFPEKTPEQRAGYCGKVHCLAIPAQTRAYIGYYVGGGSPYKHEAKCTGEVEGTWGWDYQGQILPRRIVLGLTRDRYQGGSGSYKTDGGPHIPDLPGYLNPAVRPSIAYGLHKGGEHGGEGGEGGEGH